MEIEIISKKEFWLGMSIIALMIIMSNMMNLLTLHSTKEVEIKPIRVQEVIYCTTDEKGVVECE
jgi:hypothetical protein